MASNVHKLFKTDSKLETEGIFLDYGKFKIRIARAGGSNKAYMRQIEKKSRPFRRAIQQEMLENEVAMKLMREIYAETVVIGWEGITDAEGKTLPFSKENCLKLFDELPDLFADVMDQSNKLALFREDIREEEAKN